VGGVEFVFEDVRLEGVGVLADPERAQGVPLTVCPLSNVKLRIFPTLEDHNLRQLLEPGFVIERCLSYSKLFSELIDTALERYDAARQPVGERIVRHGRLLGTHLGVNLQTEEDRRMWKLLQDPRAMMDWIAVPNFLT
jgi:hypothetical protein